MALNPNTHGYEIKEVIDDDGEGNQYHYAIAHVNGTTIALVAGHTDHIAPIQLRAMLAALLEKNGWSIKQLSFLEPPQPKIPRSTK